MAGESNSEASDEALLRGVAAGDAEALRKLHQRHAGSLFGIAWTVLRDRGEAEDVLQESFLKIWHKAGRYDAGLGRPLSWMIAVTRNAACDRARSLGRKSERRRDFEREQQAHDEEVGQAGAALDEDERRAVGEALAALPEEQREAISLAYLEGFTQTEIAARLDSPLGTIKARIRRGLLHLRRRLGGEVGEGLKD